jgi:hypothetical protein
MPRLPVWRTSQGRFSLLTSRVADTFLHYLPCPLSHRSSAEVGQMDMKAHRDRPKGTANSGRSKFRASQFAALESVTTLSVDYVVTVDTVVT